MKNRTLRALLIYLIILSIGIIATVRMVSLVVTKADYYRGNFDTSKVVVDNRLFSVNYIFKTVVRSLFIPMKMT